jgi:hypothetical protein
VSYEISRLRESGFYERAHEISRGVLEASVGVILYLSILLHWLINIICQSYFCNFDVQIAVWLFHAITYSLTRAAGTSCFTECVCLWGGGVHVRVFVFTHAYVHIISKQICF